MKRKRNKREAEVMSEEERKRGEVMMKGERWVSLSAICQYRLVDLWAALIGCSDRAVCLWMEHPTLMRQKRTTD